MLNFEREGVFVSKGIDKNCPRVSWQPTAVAGKYATVAVSEEQIRGMFRRYDTNKDGKLSKQELKNAYSALGSRMPGLRAWLALQHADANRDGYINEDEFEKLVKYTSKRGYTFN